MMQWLVTNILMQWLVTNILMQWLVTNIVMQWLSYKYINAMIIYQIEGRYNWRGPAYHHEYTCFADGTPFVYEIFRIGYFVYAVIVHQTNISYSNKVPSIPYYLIGLPSVRDKRVLEIDYQLKYAIFSTICSIVYKYCTRPISKHLYSGIFKDSLDTKHKIFKNRLNS